MSNPSSAPSGRHFYKELNGWRGLAILWIASGHFYQQIAWYNGLLNTFLQSINYALDIFSIISGFLMARFLFDRNYPSFDIGSFLKRRFLRILPLYLFFLLIVLSMPTLKIKRPTDAYRYDIAGVELQDKLFKSKDVLLNKDALLSFSEGEKYIMVVVSSVVPISIDMEVSPEFVSLLKPGFRFKEYRILEKQSDGIYKAEDLANNVPLAIKIRRESTTKIVATYNDGSKVVFPDCGITLDWMRPGTQVVLSGPTYFYYDYSKHTSSGHEKAWPFLFFASNLWNPGVKMYDHTWYISYIVHCYIFFALITYLVTRTDNPNKRRLSLIIAFGSLVLMVNAAKLIIAPDKSYLMYTTLFRADAFFLGAFCGVLMPSPNFIKNAYMRNSAPYLFFLIGALSIYQLLKTGVRYDLPHTYIYSSIGFSAMIISTVYGLSFLRKILSNGPLRFVGKYSYGVFLVHYPVGFILLSIFEPSRLHFAVFFLIAMSASILIGYAAEKLYGLFFEKFRRTNSARTSITDGNI